jgi:serine protease inhibitor ecotin
LSSQLDATLLVEGQRCTYSARLSDPYSGMMACPDREAVPLKLWLK